MSRLTLSSLSLPFAVGLLSLAANARADTSFTTDATWQISLNGGASYNAPDALSSRVLPDGSTVTGIAGGNPFNITDRFYRFNFNLTGATLLGRANFVTNDLFELLVNNNSVDLSLVVNNGTLNTNDQSLPTGLVIPGTYFQTGSNEILFKTHSFTGGSAGDPFLAARVNVSSVPEPSEVILLLSGGSLLLLRRRSARTGNSKA